MRRPAGGEIAWSAAAARLRAELGIPTDARRFGVGRDHGAAERRGWVLLGEQAGGGEDLILDERGTMWWARVEGSLAVLVRVCEPEELKPRLPTLAPLVREVLSPAFG